MRKTVKFVEHRHLHDTCGFLRFRSTWYLFGFLPVWSQEFLY